MNAAINPTQKRYFVVPAPGCYGDVTRVISSHGSLALAKKKAKSLSPGNGRYWCVVRSGDKSKGARFFRVDEQFYAEAQS